MQEETTIKKWVVSKIGEYKIRSFYFLLQKKKVLERIQQQESQKRPGTLSKQTGLLEHP